uniref:Uncharacterized protein n=1 Tax=Salix viminalis TaxID=40686 RepID=A0A6N2NGE0_SALVM
MVFPPSSTASRSSLPICCKKLCQDFPPSSNCGRVKGNISVLVFYKSEIRSKSKHSLHDLQSHYIFY